VFDLDLGHFHETIAFGMSIFTSHALPTNEPTKGGVDNLLADLRQDGLAGSGILAYARR
jgi:hypothetical protein